MRIAIMSLFYLLLNSFLLQSTCLFHPSSPIFLNSSYSHISILCSQYLKYLENKWQISSYPSFLSSSYIPPSSWNLMKSKMQSHLRKASNSLSSFPSTFIISFLGGASTAGYDVNIDHHFHNNLQKILQPFFHQLNISLIIRNVGIGGNLCTPYGLCVQTFAGNDADIIFWEHTFDCGFPECGFILEQFIRQALNSSSQPILAFTSSQFPNWKRKDCKEISMRPLAPLSHEYYHLLSTWKSEGISSVAKLNTKILSKFDYMKDILLKYERLAGFQLWDHSDYNEFSCRGPYVPHWSEGVAPWHPSRLAHELRADQLAFFWLSILKESLDELAGSSPLTPFPSSTPPPSPPFPSDIFSIPPIYSSNISSSVHCFTNYEPRATTANSITSLILLDPSPQNWEGWYSIVADTPESILERVPLGHLDMKYSIFGSSSSGPLSLRIQMISPGYIFLCEPPAVKRTFLPNLIHLWDSEMKIYLTSLPHRSHDNSFQFDSEKATQLSYFYSPCDQGCVKKGLCLQIDGIIQTGNHVLTIFPTKKERIILATILLAEKR